jgi:outer membrane protein OmpA-like peptidoglycan-associated protein
MDSMLALGTPEMQRALAARLGESAQAVHSGLTSAGAAVLDGLATKVDDDRFLPQALDFVSAAAAQDIGSNLSAIASAGPGGATADLADRVLLLVFGSQQHQVAQVLAQQSGLRAASAMAVLKMAVPLLLAVFVAREAGSTSAAGTFANMVRAEAPALRAYLPSDLLGSAAGVERSNAPEPAAPPRWLVPTAAVGALLLAWLVIRLLTASQEAAVVTTVTAEATNGAATGVNGSANEAVMAAWAALGDMMKVKLPDGIVLNVPALGVEARLVNFLNDSATPANDSSWFDFDRLLFDTGKATLQTASLEQLTNIAAILKAYPQVRIRIGGYTDNTGDPAANLRLSEERANNVMDELVKLGIDPERMNARGYGAQNPVADNSTEDGRQKNRRISLRVTDKPADSGASINAAVVRPVAVRAGAVNRSVPGSVLPAAADSAHRQPAAPP